MRIIKNIHTFHKKLKNSVVTMGVFDGVHLAHQYIIRRVVARAQRDKLISVVLTFDPHPVKVLNKKAPALLISTLSQRVKLLRDIGVDVCVILPFQKRFSDMSAGFFVSDVLSKKLSAKHLILGQDFRFGKDKQGSLAFLKKVSRKYGFSVEEVKPFKSDGKVISSSRIRRLIGRGEIRQVNVLLGRPFSILGTVTKGARRGRLLGYPTANICPEQEAIPRRGVYAARIKLNDRVYPGMVNVGSRPTFDFQNQIVIEAHIFGFSNTIYRKKIELFFIERIRSERRFSATRTLRAQLKRDARKAKEILHVSPLH